MFKRNEPKQSNEFIWLKTRLESIYKIMEEIFTIKNIVIYVLTINFIAFVAMFIDKRKAEKDRWRIKESTLLTIALIGGSIGEILGMYLFHHKTKKPRFYLGIPIMIVIQIIIIIAICNL